MSDVLATLVAMVVVFLVFSIAVSGINEWIAQATARRGQFLRLGLARIVDDDAVYRRVLHHPLIGGLYRKRAARSEPPSYIDPASFAQALASILIERANIGRDRPPLTAEALRRAVESPALAASPVSRALRPVLDRAGGDLDAALRGIAALYACGMDRVGGWYKARTQRMLFVIGLALAVLGNVDSLELLAALSSSPHARLQLAQLGERIGSTGTIGSVSMEALRSRPPTEDEWRALGPVLAEMHRTTGSAFPLGYQCLGQALGGDAARATAREVAPLSVVASCRDELQRTYTERSIGGWMLKVAGWVISALAATFGAAFWFELLSKAINLRGSGKKPGEATSGGA
jgi:hypothetical protein